MGKNNNSKTKEALKSNPCEKYELAITNYVIGEKIDIPQTELFEHLAKCRSCQDDLRNWRATYATMRAKEYDSRPEVKQKNEAFIKKLVYTSSASNKEARPVRGQNNGTKEILIDVKWDAGSAAGKIYELLKAKGKLPIPVIVKYTGLKEYHVQQGIGWLACQEKISLSRDDKTAYIQLRSDE